MTEPRISINYETIPLLLKPIFCPPKVMSYEKSACLRGVKKKNKNKNATNWKIFIYYMNEMTRFVFHSNATPTAFSRIVCRQKCMCQITPNCNTIRSTNFYRIHTMSTGRWHARVKPYYLYKIFLCVHKNISFNIYCNTFFTIHLI